MHIVTCPCHKKTSLTPSQTPQDLTTHLCDRAPASLIKRQRRASLYLRALTLSFAFHTASQPSRRKTRTQRVTCRMSQFPRRYDVEGVSFFCSRYATLSKLIWQWCIKVFCMWRHEAKCQTCLCKLVVTDSFPSSVIHEFKKKSYFACKGIN